MHARMYTAVRVIVQTRLGEICCAAYIYSFTITSARFGKHPYKLIDRRRQRHRQIEGCNIGTSIPSPLFALISARMTAHATTAMANFREGGGRQMIPNQITFFFLEPSKL